MCLWKSGRTSEAERELIAVKTAATRLFAADNEASRMSVRYLSSLYRATGRSAEAERLAQENIHPADLAEAPNTP